MALFNESKAGQNGKWFVRGMDHDKKVRVQIRVIPAGVDRELRRRVFGSVKSRRRGQTMAKEIELGEELTRARADYALMDTQNFNVGLLDDGAAKAYAELLSAPDAKKGGEVCLDGKWTKEVRDHFFDSFPKEAAWISDKADSLGAADAEEEDEATEAF